MKTRLIVVLMGLVATLSFAAEDILVEDFEGADYGAWKIEGNAFGAAPAKGTIGGQNPVNGFKGKGLVNTFLDGDLSKGTLTSPEFKIERKYITFLIGGGIHKNTCLELLVDGKKVAASSGGNDELLVQDSFDVSKYAGKMAQLRIVDNNQGGWGHVNVDHIVQSDTKPKARPKGRGGIVAEDYSEMDYNQVHRPLFHFTSKKNWLNDPNGMMYYDGEYHLFLQHNPKGNHWGNMTWGHAVSTDMMCWTQINHAILPYGGGTIFSGTGFVDHNNTLKKQEGETKTLVACFTLARKPFYQAMAYSTDKGRTFELLNDGNAVVPNQGFDSGERDPKVFWHEESKKWVMILWIKRGNPGIVRFFNSDDLVNWEQVFDFKRNWVFECMDLVPLAVRDENGKELGGKENDKWLIYDASFDYEVGTFDGKEFKTEGKTYIGDLGRNYYAAQTFNNSPDGRIVIIGWMRGSDFNRAKMPFNQQMSVPAEMTLRKIGEEIKLFRWPVKEIENLYTEKHKIRKQKLKEGANPLSEIEAEAFDLTLEFDPGDVKELKINLRNAHLTYDAQSKVLKGAGKDLPIRLVDGLVKLRVLIDRGSVEAFVNEGEYVATTYVLHRPDNKKLSLSAQGGTVDIKNLTVNEIKGFWEK